MSLLSRNFAIDIRPRRYCFYNTVNNVSVEYGQRIGMKSFYSSSTVRFEPVLQCRRIYCPHKKRSSSQTNLEWLHNGRTPAAVSSSYDSDSDSAPFEGQSAVEIHGNEVSCLNYQIPIIALIMRKCIQYAKWFGLGLTQSMGKSQSTYLVLCSIPKFRPHPICTDGLRASLKCSRLVDTKSNLSSKCFL